MISLREMKFAVTLAKVRSFSNAARELYISQPSLSQAIKTLEEKLAVTLFDRKSTSLCLTAAGEQFVREATEILELSNNLDLRQFAHLPFIYLKESQRFTQLGNALCEAEGFTPNILYSSENWETVDAMIGKGMGVGFVPELLVNAENPTKPHYFRIASPNNFRTYVAAFLHGKKLTAPVWDLIRLMSAQSPVLQNHHS